MIKILSVDYLVGCWSNEKVRRYILESDNDMRVSRMILCVVHPLRAGPVCIEIPKLDAEIFMIVDRERSLERSS